MICTESQRHMERVLKASDNRHELLTSIVTSVFNTLDDLGLTKEDASELVENTNPSSWRGAAYAGLNDYMRKLESVGDR